MRTDVVPNSLSAVFRTIIHILISFFKIKNVDTEILMTKRKNNNQSPWMVDKQ